MNGIHRSKNSVQMLGVGALSFLMRKNSSVLMVDISEKIKLHQWEKLPWRWGVERTLSWLNHSRRLSKDYEISVPSAESMVKVSHRHSLLKRL